MLENIFTFLGGFSLHALKLFLRNTCTFLEVPTIEVFFCSRLWEFFFSENFPVSTLSYYLVIYLTQSMLKVCSEFGVQVSN